MPLHGSFHGMGWHILSTVAFALVNVCKKAMGLPPAVVVLGESVLAGAGLWWFFRPLPWYILTYGAFWWRSLFAVVGSCLWTLGLQHHSLLAMMVMGFLTPFVTMVTARIVLQEALPWWRITAVILGVTGGFLCSLPLPSLSVLHPSSLWWTVPASSLCFSLANISSKRLFTQSAVKDSTSVHGMPPSQHDSTARELSASGLSPETLSAHHSSGEVWRQNAVLGGKCGQWPCGDHGSFAEPMPTAREYTGDGKEGVLDDGVTSCSAWRQSASPMCGAAEELPSHALLHNAQMHRVSVGYTSRGVEHATHFSSRSVDTNGCTGIFFLVAAVGMACWIGGWAWAGAMKDVLILSPKMMQDVYILIAMSALMGLAQMFLYKAIQLCALTSLLPLGSLRMVMNCVLAYVVYDEWPTSWYLAGCGVILCAMGFLGYAEGRWGMRHKAPSSTL